LLEYVQKYNSPWVIDVWSLGSVLLEIVSGIPLWMSLKTVVKRKNQEVIRYGLFAIKGRAFDKIIKQQLEVVQHLEQYIYEENYSGIVLEEDLKILLKRMLTLNPAKRISPTEIIEFLEQSLQEKQ
jgi:dual specificity tyrosine-phosphorylation-regulated kinase 2/3/4